MKKPPTNADILHDAIELARKLYRMDGFLVRSSYPFYDTDNPRAAGVWLKVITAYQHIAGIDLHEIVQELTNKEPK